MSRRKKDGERFNFYLKQETADRLRKYADGHSATMTQTLENIIDNYLDLIEEDDKKLEKVLADLHVPFHRRML